MAEEFASCPKGIIRLFCNVFCPNVGLQLAIGKLKIFGTVSFLNTSRRGLKEGPNKSPYCNILFEAVFDKVFCTNLRMIRGCKAIFLIVISHWLISFGSWGNFKVLTLDFEWCSFDFHCELETKTVSISRISWREILLSIVIR